MINQEDSAASQDHLLGTAVRQMEKLRSCQMVRINL